MEKDGVASELAEMMRARAKTRGVELIAVGMPHFHTARFAVLDHHEQLAGQSHSPPWNRFATPSGLQHVTVIHPLWLSAGGCHSDNGFSNVRRQVRPD
jgi:hypothetical protein